MYRKNEIKEKQIHIIQHLIFLSLYNHREQIDLKICNEVKGEQIYMNSMSTLLQNLLYKICSNVKGNEFTLQKIPRFSHYIHIYLLRR